MQLSFELSLKNIQPSSWNQGDSQAFQNNTIDFKVINFRGDWFLWISRTQVFILTEIIKTSSLNFAAIIPEINNKVPVPTFFSS